MTEVQLTLPNAAFFFDFIVQNARFASKMAQQGTKKGLTVTICGAGPSLAEEYDRLTPTDEIWACNSALPYLMDHGIRATHGFTMDQNEAMLEDWARTFDVEYLVSSSCHPKLVAHLLQDGRSLRFYHAFLGQRDPPDWKAPPTYEFWLYTEAKIYQTSIMVSNGLNSAVRAVCLALAMGFETIYLVGADCAGKPNHRPMVPPDHEDYEDWLKGLVMYADGRGADVLGPSIMGELMVGEERWHTRLDMIMSAQHILKMEREFPGRIVTVGHTLPNALRQMDEEWMKGLPVLRNGRISNLCNRSQEAA